MHATRVAPTELAWVSRNARGRIMADKPGTMPDNNSRWITLG